MNNAIFIFDTALIYLHLNLLTGFYEAIQIILNIIRSNVIVRSRRRSCNSSTGIITFSYLISHIQIHSVTAITYSGKDQKRNESPDPYLYRRLSSSLALTLYLSFLGFNLGLLLEFILSFEKFFLMSLSFCFELYFVLSSLELNIRLIIINGNSRSAGIADIHIILDNESCTAIRAL